jgi:iron complex outermembrane recepter protein
MSEGSAMQLHPRKVALAVGLSLAGAQAAPAQDMRINVTGTNIKRADTETAAPIETITREDILASGLQTISEILRQITANNNGSISPSFTNGFSASGSAISLRGLGPNNTLVLLNGRRLANFGLADDKHASYVDLQQIPFDAVERIEILKDGASAIYGSDAVAGVVNVILRQQYTGITATATGGIDYNGEGRQVKGALTAGVGDLTRDRYNFFVTVDGQKQDAIASRTGRDYIGTNDLRFMGLPDLRGGLPPGGGVAPVSFLGTVAPLTGNAYRSLPGSCPPSAQTDGFCRWDTLDYTDLQPKIERYNVFARGTYAIDDNTQAYAEASYFHVTTDTRLSPSFVNAIWTDPATGTLVSTRPLLMPPGHPDNPFGASGQAARLLYIDGNLPRDVRYDTGTQRYLAGLQGSHAGWDWDAAALYLRSVTDVSWSHLYSYARLLQGMDGTGPYGYYRIGSAAANNDPAIYDWIAPARSYSTLSENTVIDAKASRDLAKLAGGALAVAVGYEFRREEVSNPGIPGTANGDVVGMDYTAAAGARTVNALYAELYAPLLRNLDVTAAVRYDHYSDFGGTTNPKIGVKWAAMPELVLRSTWQTAFRAPGLYEAGVSTQSGYFSPVDPVRCPVTGLPVDCGGSFALQSIAGSADLKPERSTTFTAGVIVEPVPGLSATIDYWNIRTKGQITFPELNAVLLDPGAFQGSSVIRAGNDLPGIPNSGTILFVGTQFQNVSLVETDGIDLDFVWKQALGDYGNLRTELQWTHVFAYTQTFGGGARYDFVGTQGPYSISSAGGTPQDRANLIVTYARGPFSVTGTLRYVSDYQAINWQGDTPPPDAPQCLPPIDTPGCHVASFTTFDLSASYSGWKNWQVFGSIINVFNRIAPFNPAAAYGGVNYNYNWAFSGATGTQFNLGVRYTFD